MYPMAWSVGLKKVCRLLQTISDRVGLGDGRDGKDVVLFEIIAPEGASTVLPSRECTNKKGRL